MTPRERALRCVLLLAAFVAELTGLTLSILRDLANELADDVRASRRISTNTVRGNMSTRNVKLLDSTTALRAQNAKLAALVGDTSQAQKVLSDSRQLAAELSMSARRSA